MAGCPDKKHPKCSPPAKVHQESEDKDHSGSKHWESKHQKDKEDSKSPCTWGEKEHYLEDPPWTFKASSLNHQLNETDDLFSLSGPMNTSTPSKAGLGGSHLQAMSINSRHSFTTSESGIGNAFILPSSSAICHTSVA